MPACLPENIDEKLRCPIDNLRNFREIRHGVDEAVQLQYPPDPVQITPQRDFRLCQHAECRKPGRRLPFGQVEFSTHLADKLGLAVQFRDRSGNQQHFFLQGPAFDLGGDRWCRDRNLNAQFGKALVDPSHQLFPFPPKPLIYL